MEFSAVEDDNNILHGKYPVNLSNGEKANLRRKCRNYKMEAGLLYYRKFIPGATDQLWKICIRTNEEKKRIF